MLHQQLFPPLPLPLKSLSCISPCMQFHSSIILPGTLAARALVHMQQLLLTIKPVMQHHTRAPAAALGPAGDVQLALQIVQLDLEHPDLIQPVPILRLALGQRRVLDLDLFVQQRQLIIAADELQRVR
eukprot:scaffold20262_cov17-Tisochrysis_lutea.AAC.2